MSITRINIETHTFLIRYFLQIYYQKEEGKNNLRKKKNGRTFSNARFARLTFLLSPFE